MDPVAAVAILSALFAGSHLLLASSVIRRRLVERLGEFWFVVVYSLVSWLTFGAALFYYERHRLEGPAGLDVPWLFWPAVISTVIGVCLIVGILSPTGYVESPMAMFSGKTREPRGLGRVTRHPMFAGMALFGVGHCFLAGTMIGVVYFGFLAALGVAGGWHQDAKLRSLRGDVFQAYLEKTSAVPFVAVIRGRQKLVFGELPWVFLGLGLLAAWGLHAMHGADFAYTAHVILAGLIFGPIGLTAWSFAKHRRND